MIGLDFGLADVKALAAQWSPAHRAALTRAFRAELFRLRVAQVARFRAGIDPARRAPLTRGISSTRSTRALSWFGPMTAYELTEPGAGEVLVGTVGLTAQGAKRRRPPAVEFLTRAVTGGPQRIDRARQGLLAQRLRDRGVSERRLAKLIPREGSSTFTPRRDFAEQLTRAELGKTLGHVAALYRRALAGERWKAQWWR